MANQKPIYSKELKILVEQIREARLAAGLTQTELAQHLGKKSHTAVVKLEQGQVRVELLELRRICSICRVPFRDFIDRLENDLEKTERSGSEAAGTA